MPCEVVRARAEGGRDEATAWTFFPKCAECNALYAKWTIHGHGGAKVHIKHHIYDTNEKEIIQHSLNNINKYVAQILKPHGAVMKITPQHIACRRNLYEMIEC